MHLVIESDIEGLNSGSILFDVNRTHKLQLQKLKTMPHLTSSNMLCVDELRLQPLSSTSKPLQPSPLPTSLEPQFNNLPKDHPFNQSSFSGLTNSSEGIDRKGPFS